MSQPNNNQAPKEKPNRPKNLKSYEVVAWEIQTSKGVNYGDWKKEQLAKQQMDLLQGKNPLVENMIMEMLCSKLVEKELPTILEKLG